MGKPGKKAGKGKLPPTNPNRTTDPTKSHLRDQRTIKRLKMYNSKIVRNEKGEIVKGSVLSASDRIDQDMARIAPDRRWFGNTRVIGQQALQKFRSEMGERFRDPYSVVIKQKKLPLSLLEDPTVTRAAAHAGGVAQQMQFNNTFGAHATRKRVKLASSCGTMEELAQRATSSQTAVSISKQEARDAVAAATATLGAGNTHSVQGMNAAGSSAAQFRNAARRRNTAGAMTASESHPQKNDDDDDDANFGEADKSNWSLFKKGQSNRIWNELYKVIDSSDVICYIVDARDPMGTRSPFIEDYLRREKKHKHFVLVLNKCDLVPLWATARWLQILSRDFPTIAFHASVDHPFGKGNLISLLRQFSRLHNVSTRGRSKAPISVGVVGYPNVGKSSVINTLRRKSVCKSAPIPGETKIWQYVALTRSIFLIDCPGIVYDREGNSNVNAVLKGVVRVERLGSADKTDVVQAVIDMVNRRDIENTYNLTDWHDAQTFLELLATARGKLLPGGVPDTDIVARSVLYDWQRGKIPWFVAPPFDSERAKQGATKATDQSLLTNIEKLNNLNIEGDQIERADDVDENFGAGDDDDDNDDDDQQQQQQIADEDDDDLGSLFDEEEDFDEFSDEEDFDDDDDDDDLSDSDDDDNVDEAPVQQKKNSVAGGPQRRGRGGESIATTATAGAAAASSSPSILQRPKTTKAGPAAPPSNANRTKPQQTTATPAQLTTGGSARGGKQPFSTIVTAAAEAEANAKKQKRHEQRKQQQAETSAMYASAAAAAASSSANSSN